MFKRLKNQRGVALLIVMSTVLLVMTPVVTEMITQMLTNHQIAINAQNRAQAYYLAKSGLNFSKLLMHYNKKLESEVEKAGVSSSTLSAVGYQPLYKMFPLSSELFRGLVGATAAPEDEEDGEVDAQDTAEEDLGDGLMDGESLMSDETLMQGQTNFLDKKKAEEFLSFDGNFEAEISEEASKYSLNTISKMSATSPNYDLFKKVLVQLLLDPQYKNFFENQEQDAEKLVHALGDYVDTNDTINEFEQVERGREESIYDEVDFKVKNAKYLTLSEARLVAGMNDDIFNLLQNLITVYHTAENMNVCLADPKILDALIVYYTKFSECTNPIDADDTETLEELRDEVLAMCPDKSAMASALNVKLGIKSEQEVTQAQTTGTAETQQTSSQVTGCKVQFVDLLSESNDVFTIRAKGVVGEVQRTITVVMDTSASSPAAWKTLYYQVR